jgi:hypothetical protein
LDFTGNIGAGGLAFLPMDKPAVLSGIIGGAIGFGFFSWFF